MSPKDVTRILIVANRTAATPTLLEALERRATQGHCHFTLLVPRSSHGLHRFVDPEDQGSAEAKDTLELALPLIEEAVGSRVEGMTGDPDPMCAIQDAVNLTGFDEIIISTLSRRVSRWLRLDLPHKVAGLGLPVTVVTAKGYSSVGVPVAGQSLSSAA